MREASGSADPHLKRYDAIAIRGVRGFSKFSQRSSARIDSYTVHLISPLNGVTARGTAESCRYRTMNYRDFRKSIANRRGAVLRPREPFHADRRVSSALLDPPFSRYVLAVYPAKGKKLEPPRADYVHSPRVKKNVARCTRVSEAGTRTTAGLAVFARGASDTIVRASTSGKRALNGFLRRLLAPVISMRESLNRWPWTERDAKVARGRRDGSARLCGSSPSSLCPIHAERVDGVAGGKNRSASIRANARVTFPPAVFIFGPLAALCYNNVALPLTGRGKGVLKTIAVLNFTSKLNPE